MEDEGVKKKKFQKGLTQSVVPGQLMGNQKKFSNAKNLVQSVQQGLLHENTLKKEGVLHGLADDANLPDDITELGNKEEFNLLNYCELCEVTFNKLKGVNRHHCRKCFKSVCQPCSANKRKLAKNDETLHRVCDYCDTVLSNYKLEQNQVAILKAQQDQMQMYMEQL